MQAGSSHREQGIHGAQERVFPQCKDTKKKTNLKNTCKAAQRRPGKSCGSSPLRCWRGGPREAFFVSPRNPQINLKHTLISVCSETFKLDEHKNKQKTEESSNISPRTKKLVLPLERTLAILLNQAYRRRVMHLRFISSNSFLSSLH